MRTRTKPKRGFTLIEVLTVVAILSVFASVIYVASIKARARADDVRRIADLKQIQTALELYYSDNHAYPSTQSGGTYYWFGNCTITAGWGIGSKPTTGAAGYIPGLAPTYLPVLPVDPKPATNTCYIYISNGIDYSLLAHMTMESYTTGVSGNNPYPRVGTYFTSGNTDLYNQPDFDFYSTGGQTW
jgi:prepilin-type N-terminal cleavage/methylation domain-containing protein